MTWLACCLGQTIEDFTTELLRYRPDLSYLGR
jgi:hypothetical protein